MKEPNNKLSRWFGERWIVRLMLLAALLALGVINSDKVYNGFKNVIHAAGPLVWGAALAYVLDIYIDRMERILLPNSKRTWVIRARRPAAIALAVLVLIGFALLLIYVIIPGLAAAVALLARELPHYFADAKEWVLDTFEDVSAVKDFVDPIEFDWNAISASVIQWATGGNSSTTLLSSTMFMIGEITGELADLMICLIFAIFLISGRKKLKRQFIRLSRAVMSERKCRSLGYALGVCNRSFSGFIVGQTLYGLVSGLSTWIGMFIFGMPYAIVVGVLCGTFMLIPIIGGYIGAAIGAFLVFTASPSMTVWFLLFVITLQTLEGNLIYPRLIGSSLGMPGLWVLAAVTLGGGLGGISGMLLSVPLAATGYTLVKSWVQRKEESAAQEEKDGPREEEAEAPRKPEPPKPAAAEKPPRKLFPPKDPGKTEKN